jgi:hypothetical protein
VTAKSAPVLIDHRRALRDADYLLAQFERITGRKATAAEEQELRERYPLAKS